MEKKSRTKLKPCPFCGGNDIREGENMMKCCYCPDCGVRGPIMDFKTQARKAWNELPREEKE